MFAPSSNLRSLILICIVSAPALCIAQDWYEIEIIIFEHRHQDKSADAERWPADLDLTWPSPLLELEPPVERTELPEIFPAFEELGFDQRRMNNDSYALRVREPYELLWHRAWKAPLLPEGKAPWILVQAGEKLGAHYRLEGAIRLHLSRYLHVHTDLWLTEVSGDAIIEESFADIGKDSALVEAENKTASADDGAHRPLNSVIEAVEAKSEFDWSQLPEPDPVRQGCHYVHELWPEDDRLLPTDYYADPAPVDWYFPFGCRIPAELRGRELPYPANVPASGRYAKAEPADTDLIDGLEDQMALPAGFGAANTGISHSTEEPVGKNLQIDAQALPEKIEPPLPNKERLFEEVPERIPAVPPVRYPVREIIHIQGKRRMRSGEFHYIDHPNIGVLALVHPVAKPELVLKPVEESAAPGGTGSQE